MNNSIAYLLQKNPPSLLPYIIILIYGFIFILVYCWDQQREAGEETRVRWEPGQAGELCDGEALAGHHGGAQRIGTLWVLCTQSGLSLVHFNTIFMYFVYLF